MCLDLLEHNYVIVMLLCDHARLALVFFLDLLIQLIFEELHLLVFLLCGQLEVALVHQFPVLVDFAPLVVLAFHSGLGAES